MEVVNIIYQQGEHKLSMEEIKRRVILVKLTLVAWPLYFPMRVGQCSLGTKITSMLKMVEEELLMRHDRLESTQNLFYQLRL